MKKTFLKSFTEYDAITTISRGGASNLNLYEALKKYSIFINKHVHTKKNFSNLPYNGC